MSQIRLTKMYAKSKLYGNQDIYKNADSNRQLRGEGDCSEVLII
jgi:hypothetical protein